MRTIRKILDITTITGNQNEKINTKTGSNIEDGAQNRTYTRIRPECKHRKITSKLYTKEADRSNRNKYQDLTINLEPIVLNEIVKIRTEQSKNVKSLSPNSKSTSSDNNKPYISSKNT